MFAQQNLKERHMRIMQHKDMQNNHGSYTQEMGHQDAMANQAINFPFQTPFFVGTFSDHKIIFISTPPPPTYPPLASSTDEARQAELETARKVRIVAQHAALDMRISTMSFFDGRFAMMEEAIIARRNLKRAFDDLKAAHPVDETILERYADTREWCFSIEERFHALVEDNGL